MFFFLCIVYRLLVGPAAATTAEADAMIRSKIATAQFMTDFSWCTYPIFYPLNLLIIVNLQCLFYVCYHLDFRYHGLLLRCVALYGHDGVACQLVHERFKTEVNRSFVYFEEVFRYCFTTPKNARNSINKEF